MNGCLEGKILHGIPYSTYKVELHALLGFLCSLTMFHEHEELYRIGDLPHHLRNSRFARDPIKGS